MIEWLDPGHRLTQRECRNSDALLFADADELPRRTVKLAQYDRNPTFM
jgi:hypothetical protein